MHEEEAGNRVWDAWAAFQDCMLLVVSLWSSLELRKARKVRSVDKSTLKGA